RLPDHERRPPRARELRRLRHGRSAGGGQPTRPLPGRGDVRGQPDPRPGARAAPRPRTSRRRTGPGPGAGQLRPGQRRLTAPGDRQARAGREPPLGPGRRAGGGPEMTPARRQLSPLPFDDDGRLPRLPLPGLDDSCARFLAWCAPLLTQDELAETRAAVAACLHQDSPARRLQAELEAKEARGEAGGRPDALLGGRYLRRRGPIALGADYFFLFEDCDRGQVERAAGLITAAVDYKLLLDEHRIRPDVRGSRPLPAHQNRFLFSTTRIPGTTRDTVRSPYSADWRG